MLPRMGFMTRPILHAVWKRIYGYLVRLPVRMGILGVLLVFHSYLLYRFWMDQNIILVLSLLIPIGIFSYRLMFYGRRLLIRARHH